MFQEEIHLLHLAIVYCMLKLYFSYKHLENRLEPIVQLNWFVINKLDLIELSFKNIFKNIMII